MPKVTRTVRFAQIPLLCCQSIQTEPLRPELESVAGAVAVYLAAREQPKRWVELLAKHGLLEQAENHPLATVFELCSPWTKKGVRRCYESAFGWCLAQMDLSQVSPDDLVVAMTTAGGIDKIHAQWRSNRDQFLYGEN